MLTHHAARALGAATLFAASAAAAQPGNQNVAFLATSNSGIPSFENFNSSGATNSYTLLGGGLVQVTLPGMGDGLTSNVQVNAINSNGSPHYCAVEGWGSNNGVDVTVYVGCFRAGVPDYSDFAVFYQSRPGSAPGGWLGFVWADQPSNPSYTPSTFYNYNNRGLTNTITRQSTGRYTVTFPGLTGGGNPQVSGYGAYGQAVPALCTITGWTGRGASTQVGVACFDTAGNPADEYFSLSYNRSALEGEGAIGGAFAFANRATGRSYKPALSYSETGATLTAQRYGQPVQGLYSLVVSNPSNVFPNYLLGMVSAVNTGPAVCEVGGYGQDVGDFYADIECFDGQARALNTQYSAAFFIQ